MKFISFLVGGIFFSGIHISIHARNSQGHTQQSEGSSRLLEKEASSRQIEDTDIRRVLASKMSEVKNLDVRDFLLKSDWVEIAGMSNRIEEVGTYTGHFCPKEVLGERYFSLKKALFQFDLDFDALSQEEKARSRIRGYREAIYGGIDEQKAMALTTERCITINWFYPENEPAHVSLVPTKIWVQQYSKNGVLIPGEYGTYFPNAEERKKYFVGKTL